jgi:uncharacterized protein (DUF983 family)
MPRPDRQGSNAPHQATVWQRLRWAMLLRCPRCGGRGIWRSWFTMKDRCPACGQDFERGETSDFWIGAYLIYLVVAELSAVVVAGVMWATLGSRVSFNVLWGASMALAVLMPVLFYPFSRDLWLAVDIHIRPSEAGDM